MDWMATIVELAAEGSRNPDARGRRFSPERRLPPFRGFCGMADPGCPVQ